MNQFLSKYKFPLAIFGTIVPFLMLSIFTQPIAEDFGFATQAQKNEFFQLLFDSYKTMNGRYMANIFMYASPITFNSFLFYKIIPAVLIILMISSCKFFIKQVLPELESKKHTILAIGITTIYLSGMPIISEGLYWYTGASIYFIGLLFMILMFGYCAKAINSAPSISNYLITAILIFIACGFNETQTAIVTTSITILVLVHYRKKTIHRTPLTFLFLFTLAFSSLMIFAPGNQFRSNMYINNTHNFIHSTSYSFAQLVRFSIDWVLSIPLITISGIAILNLGTLQHKSKLIQNGFYLNKWFSLLLLLVSILICVFPSYWFTGILGQHRTLNVGYFVFIVLWFINLSTWLKESHYHHKIVRLIQPYKIHLVVLFFIGCFFTDNGFYAIKDIISGQASQFNQQLNARHTVLAKKANIKGTEIILEPISAKPTSLFVSDISTDPNYWMNLGYNNFYRLDSVAIFIQP